MNLYFKWPCIHILHTLCHTIPRSTPKGRLGKETRQVKRVKKWLRSGCIKIFQKRFYSSQTGSRNSVLLRFLQTSPSVFLSSLCVYMCLTMFFYKVWIHVGTALDFCFGGNTAWGISHETEFCKKIPLVERKSFLSSRSHKHLFCVMEPQPVMSVFFQQKWAWYLNFKNILKFWRIQTICWPYKTFF